MPELLPVEDNEMNRDMQVRRLTRRGYEIVLAVDGGEAVEKAAAESPDLVLMDITLPGMSGWDATREIRRSEKTRAIPVIALTALAMVGDRERSIAAGCDDYETKPIDLPRLLAKVEALLEKGRKVHKAWPEQAPRKPLFSTGRYMNLQYRCRRAFR